MKAVTPGLSEQVIADLHGNGWIAPGAGKIIDISLNLELDKPIDSRAQ
jgi:hypothetical protein